MQAFFRHENVRQTQIKGCETNKPIQWYEILGNLIKTLRMV